MENSSTKKAIKRKPEQYYIAVGGDMSICEQGFNL